MKLFALLTMLVTLGSNQPVYSLTTGTETGSTTSLKQNGPRSSLTSATLNRALREDTTGSIEASADIVPATPRTPLYSKAIRGWNVPLGQRERTTGSVINRFIIHHTTNTGD